MKNIKLCLIFIIYLILFIAVPFYITYFFIFIALHEMCHCIACKKYGLDIKSITILPFGFNARISDDFINPMQDMIIAASGPACNLIFYAVFLLLNMFTNNYFKNQQFVNLILFVFNMIPAGFLDGGRILSAVIRNYISIFLGTYVICLNGIIFGCIITIMAFLNLPNVNAIFMILMGVYFIILNILKLKDIKFLVLNDIIYKESYIKNKKKFRIEIKGYSKDNHIFDIIKNFSMSSYYIVYTFDLNSSSTLTIEESEILNAFLTYGNITLESLT